MKRRSLSGREEAWLCNYRVDKNANFLTNLIPRFSNFLNSGDHFLSWSITRNGSMFLNQIFLSWKKNVFLYFFAVPTKKLTEKNRQPGTPTIKEGTPAKYESNSKKMKIAWFSKANSETNEIFLIPRRSQSSTSTPGSARKVMMGLERGLNRVRCVLTPKRRTKNEENNSDQPNMLSGKVRSSSTLLACANLNNSLFRSSLLIDFRNA